MGKKSNQKKENQERKLKEKAAAKVAKENAKKIRREKWNEFRKTLPRKFALLLTIVALTILLGLVSMFIWTELTKPKSISHYVPQDTVTFAEFDTNLEGEQWQNYFNLTDGKNVPSIAAMIQQLNSIFNVDIMNQVYPWLARRAGVALLADHKTALFLEVKDQNLALDFFRKRTLSTIIEDLKEKDMQGVTTYRYIASSPITLAFLGNYLVVGSDEKALEEVISVTKNSKTALFANSDYQRIQNTVPQNGRLGFVFFRPQQLNLFSQNSMENSPASSAMQLLESSFSKNISDEVVTVKALQNMFAIEHVALLSKSFRDKKSFVKLPKKYRANLATLAFSDKTQLFIGGIDLGLEAAKMDEMFAGHSKKTTSIESPLQDFISAKMKEILGGKISSDDWRKLFAGEYAIGIDNGKFKVALELNNPIEQEKILKKIGEQIHTTTKNNIAIISFAGDRSSEESISASFSDTASFKSYVQPQLQAGDDMIYIKPSEISAQFAQLFGIAVPAFLANLEEISLSTNSFEDAIKTIILFAP